MVFDFLKPFLYYLEAGVVSRIIPDVSNIQGRKLLKDHPIIAEQVTYDASKWDAVLKKHVRVVEGPQTLVDYESIAQDENFSKFLEQMRTTDPDKLQPVEQFVFWMNAYNALCINLIVQHDQQNTSGDKLKSITHLSDKGGTSVWDKPAGKVNNNDVTLNTIEHERLRKVWAEPLVHACIVCASLGCPNLRPEAFCVDKIYQQMEDQMKQWMTNQNKGFKLDRDAGLHLQCHLYLSRIFLWFANDFGGWKGVQQFLPQFLDDEKVRARLNHGHLAVRYFEYDWTMNRLSAATAAKPPETK